MALNGINLNLIVVLPGKSKTKALAGLKSANYLHLHRPCLVSLSSCGGKIESFLLDLF